MPVYCHPNTKLKAKKPRRFAQILQFLHMRQAKAVHLPLPNLHQQHTVFSVAYLSEKDLREMYANPKGSKLILLFSPSVINVASRTALHASSSSILLFIFHR
jgi:hypothetical protein